MAIVIKQWNAARLSRFRSELSEHVSEAELCPASGSIGPHPAYMKIGEVIHRTSTQIFKPLEIPAEMRGCPWVYVIAELQREFPNEKWNAKALLNVVEFYLSHTACEAAAEQSLPLLEWGKHHA